MATNKATNTEMQTRVAEVFKLLLKGLNRPEVLQYAANTWGVSERTADNYIARARKEYVKHVDNDRARNFAMMQHRLEDLYKRTMKLQDYKTSLAILKEYGSLLDLYPAKRQELTGEQSGSLTINVLVAPERPAELPDADVIVVEK